MSAPVKPARLRNDVLMTYGGKVGAVVLFLVISVVLARELGASGRGTLAVAVSFALILAQLGSLGVATANPYFAASRRSSVGSLVTASIWLAALVGVTVAAAGLVIYEVAPGVVGGVDTPTLLIALATVPATLATFFFQSLLLGEGRIAAYGGVEVGQGLLILTALMVAVVVSELTPARAVAVMGVGTYAAAGAMLLLLRGHRPFFGMPDWRLVRSLLHYGVKIYAATILAFLVLRLDVLLVNAYLGSHDAGIYAVTAGLAEAMYLLPAAIGLNLFARIARGGATQMTAEVFRSIAVVYAVVCLISLVLAKPAIEIMYGPAFSQATEMYYWLLPGVFALGMLTIISNHLAGRGYPTEAIFIWVAGLVVNVVLNVTLLESRGLYIASLASTIAYVMLLVLHMALLSKDVGGWRELVPRPREFARFLRTAASRSRS